jgi:cell division protein FtsI (penicillin-binding protein 3)
VAFLAATGHLQIVKGTHYDRIADRVWETEKLPGRRGTVFDRHGVVLATSGGRSDYQERIYPLGEAACHVIGFVGKDLQGLAGIEHSLDTLLCASPGERVVFRDGRRHRHLFTRDIIRQPEHGCDVRLTLDATYQCILAQELERGMLSAGAKAAWAVMLDPGTGEIFAMASLPSYDPEWAVVPGGGYTCPEDHYRNHSISYAFEPGSSFKVITAAAALEAGIVHPGTVIDCEEGAYVVGRRTIHDIHPHGELTFAEVLAYSSNTGTAKVAELLGEERLYDKVRAFGFGASTGLPLPGESDGVLRRLRTWSGYSLVSISFGQEVSVTAVQLAQAVAAVANGGVLMRPRLLLEARTPSGEVVASSRPEAIRRVASPATCVTLSKLMAGVVEMGTGRRAALQEVAVAGKTGTAQKFVAGEVVGYISTFVGFAPAENPAFVVVIVLDEPIPEYLGGVVCAPVFQRTLLRMLTSPGGCLFRPLAQAASRGTRRREESVASAATLGSGDEVG